MSGHKRLMYLIIEEPRNCLECPVLEDGDECVLGGTISYERRPPGCRLRPLPEKLRTDGKDLMKRAAGYAYGWNDCLNELEGSGKWRNET